MKLIPNKIDTYLDDKKRVHIRTENGIDYPLGRVTDLIIIDKINEILEYLEDRDK